MIVTDVLEIVDQQAPRVPTGLSAAIGRLNRFAEGTQAPHLLWPFRGSIS
jgi:hypothetical protein